MIKLGFIGTGNISRRHFSALEKLKNQAEVVAVCDLIEDRAAAAAEPVGAHAYTSPHEMFSREKLDGVYICVPPDAHVDQELICAEKGIHFFVEKPLPLDIKKAEQIAKAVRESGIVAAVGYQWRHFSQTQYLRAQLESDRVGMALGYFLNLLPGSPWWRIKSRSGGQVVEQAIHIFDTARYLLGEVDQVYASYGLRGLQDEPGFEQEDVYTVNLRFASGAVGNFQTTCMLHRRWNVGLDVICHKRAYRLHEKELEIDDADGVRTVAIENDPGFDENATFLRAISGGDRSGVLSDYEDALKTQRLVLAANHSAEIGEAIRLR
jgi:myo-inositol 2-dehydrogenase / D-chiro-inositol 1-dehydrogenase